jgi:hypothetical protein
MKNTFIIYANWKMFAFFEFVGDLLMSSSYVYSNCASKISTRT